MGKTKHGGIEMVQDKKKFTSGNKTNEASKNLDNRKGQTNTTDKNATRSGTMKDNNLSKDKDIASKRDVGTRK